MSNKYKKSELCMYNYALNDSLYPVHFVYVCCIQKFKTKWL